MTVHVLSFDFDLSLFNKFYADSATKDVIESNRKFLDAIKANNHLYTNTFVFVGSNRQCKRTDDTHLITTKWQRVGSCFPAIKRIADYLNARLIPFLLADLFGNLPHGTSYERIINEQEGDVHADCPVDETKAILLYAQIHKIAQEIADKSKEKNPKKLEPIVFDFYDDNEEILAHLAHFFNQKNKILLPEHVTLRLHQYDGGEAKLKHEIKGQGFIDKNYSQTVKDMVAYHRRHFPQQEKFYIASCVTPNVLLNWIPWQKTEENAQAMPQFAPYSFFSSARYQDTYTYLWNQVEGDSLVRKAKAILRDYTKQDFIFGSVMGRFISGHWNRHHVEDVSTIIAKEYDSISDLLAALNKLDPTHGGSLFRRIQFIEQQTVLREQSFLECGAN